MWHVGIEFLAGTAMGQAKSTYAFFYYNYSIIFQHTTIIRLTMQDINAWHHGHFRKTDNSIFITLERTSLPFLSSVTWCDHMGVYILRHSCMYYIYASVRHALMILAACNMGSHARTLPGSPNACRHMFMRARNVHRLVYACLHKRDDISVFLYPQIYKRLLIHKN